MQPLDPAWVKKYRGNDGVGPFYVQPEDVGQLGIKWTVVNGDDVFEYDDRKYVKQGDLNYLASLADPPQKVVIRSVTDLLELVAQHARTDWIFRGHSSVRWNLLASVHRVAEGYLGTVESVIAFERELLNEFKRRARIFLPSPPSSDWEWMVLGQHFGLPTRILDWTENPLVGLYFSVRDEAQAGEDGMLFAYRHGEREINIESSSDPFAITQIELMRPPHLDQRVIAQQSIFTAEPHRLSKGGRSGSDIKYWYVSGSHKPDIRNELAKLGITESTLFPGLVSLAAEIKNSAIQRMKHKRNSTQGTKKRKVSKARSAKPTR